MTRLALAMLILLALTTLVWWFVARTVNAPTKPEPDGSNAQWEEYYIRMAGDARKTGDEKAAAEYESLARTYQQFDDPGNW